MKRAGIPIRFLIALVLILGLIYFSFSRPWYRPTPFPVALPEDLATWLRDRESPLPIRKGLQKEIEWSSREGQTSDWAIAYLHGFSASRKEISPTLERVAGILRANVFWSRLSGHGMSGEEFKDLSADRFFEDSEEALQILSRIGKKRILVGGSTGAPLAIAEALWHPESVDAIVLISPNFAAANPYAWLSGGPLGTMIARIVIGRERSWKAKSPEHEFFWNNRYRVEGLTAMTDMVNAVKRMPLENLRTPCLVLMTKADQVVDLAIAQKTLSRIPDGVCEIRWIEAEDHVLAGDVLSPSSTETVVGEILSFVRKVSALAAKSTN